MSFRTTSFLLLVLAVLGGFLYFNATYNRPKSKTADTTFVYKFQSDDILTMDIRLPDKSLSLKYKPDEQQWYFADPERPAENGPSSNLALILSGPAANKTISQSPLSADQMAEYGLAKPSIIANVTTKSGNSNRVLLGDTTPDGKYHYTKNANSDTIYLVDQVWGAELVRTVNNPPNPTPTPAPTPSATPTPSS